MSLQCKNVSKVYQVGEVKTEALKGVDLTIKDGEFIVVLGPSGSGKSTLLNVMSGLDQVSEGVIEVDNEKISSYSQKELTTFRRENLGFIFQQYNLLQTLSVRENIEIGAHLSNDPFDIDDLIEKVGLKDHKTKYPYQLSGGEQQRVSIARALSKKPKILFCDEPTGALDEATGKKILALLQSLNEDLKTTIVLITHNPSIALLADRVLKMNSGEIINVEENKEKQNAESIDWR